jgi:hypothetical protein
LTTRDGETGEQPEDDPKPQDDAASQGSNESAASQERRESAIPHEQETPESPLADTDEAPKAGDERRGEDGPIAGASAGTAKETVQRAREQLESLLGRTPESVSALERVRGGWLVTLEVVEVARIPESTDVLASYEMELDEDGNLRRYARVCRYRRSQAENGEGR